METVEILETDEFRRWFEGLRDVTAKFRILARLRRLSLGNLGDARAVGGGVMELRIDQGPGYCVYFIRRDKTLMVLLAGGDKSSRHRDVERAKELARRL